MICLLACLFVCLLVGWFCLFVCWFVLYVCLFVCLFVSFILIYLFGNPNRGSNNEESSKAYQMKYVLFN